MALDLMMRIEGAQFKLEPFALRHAMLTPPELQKAVRSHYFRSIKRHLLSTLGSLQALGNPVGLLRGLVQGASDAVAEPLEGLVRTVEQVRWARTHSDTLSITTSISIGLGPVY